MWQFAPIAHSPLNRHPATHSPYKRHPAAWEPLHTQRKIFLWPFCPSSSQPSQQWSLPSPAGTDLLLDSLDFSVLLPRFLTHLSLAPQAVSIQPSLVLSLVLTSRPKSQCPAPAQVYQAMVSLGSCMDGLRGSVSALHSSVQLLCFSPRL